jgi:hypothetical protein
MASARLARNCSPPPDCLDVDGNEGSTMTALIAVSTPTSTGLTAHLICAARQLPVLNEPSPITSLRCTSVGAVRQTRSRT